MSEKCKNMSQMFAGAKSFNQDFSGWNVEECKNMEYTFYNAKKFNKGSVKNRDFFGTNTSMIFYND